MNLHRIVGQRIPAIIPWGWRQESIGGHDCLSRLYPTDLRALFSIDRLEDGKEWRHISFSRADRYPDWHEMIDAIRGDALFDPRKDVVMVLPPKSEYVNIHPNCFHWWQEVLS